MKSKVSVKLKKWLFPQLIWEMPSDEKSVYLTFDDGPTPVVTIKVLEVLKKYNAVATFFCLGSNIDKFPAIFEQIKLEGHGIGSHGYNHINGFRTLDNIYIENLKEGMRLTKTNLFRPPFGKITLSQISKIHQFTKIIIWSISSRDYDLNYPASKSLHKLITNIYPGAIILFHDTEKASETLFYALPRLLEFFSDHGIKTNIIDFQ